MPKKTEPAAADAAGIDPIDPRQPYVVLSRLQYEGELFVPAAADAEPTIVNMLPEHAEEMIRRGIVMPYVGEITQPAA